ncbi:MAG: hypothetical protein H6673_15465 [Anaerolineales bacterium]|nr:hypothetical protein [Anaerolineales bacterium]
MSNATHPNFPSDYVLFPQGGSHFVVDFWSGQFEVGAATPHAAMSEFPVRMAACLKQKAYAGDTHGRPRWVTFSSGLIGVGRNMFEYRTRHAKAFVCFKAIQRFTYVSLRVVYPKPLSWLKILGFLAVIWGLSLLNRLWWMITDTFYYGYYGYTWGDFLEVVVYQLRPDMWSYTLPAALYFGIPLTIIRGLYAHWRSGRFWNFLREDFQEVYRDDLSAIGQSVYMAIMDTADSLSLQQVGPVQPPPTFGGLDNGSPLTRRPKRI